MQPAFALPSLAPPLRQGVANPVHRARAARGTCLRRRFAAPSMCAADASPASSSASPGGTATAAGAAAAGSSASASASASATCAAVGADARALARLLAAHWCNRAQAHEFPTFWSHIHVVFRPLPWALLGGYAFYTESAYDYNLGLPYKSSVVRIDRGADGRLELASYKPSNAEDLWLGAHEPDLLAELTADRLTALSTLCNSVFEPQDALMSRFVGRTREGKLCRIRRGGTEPESYLDSTIDVTENSYKAWDVGRDPETEERMWGTPAGPFEFECVERLDHLVPPEPPSE